MSNHKLSEHFTVEEMCFSATAARNGMYNLPSLIVSENLKLTCIELEVIRAHYGVPVNVISGYRSQAVNKAVGGSLTSAHLAGLAADIRIPGIPVIEVCRWCRDNLLDFDQIIYEFGPQGWTHVGLRPQSPRRETLTAIKKDGKTEYLTGIKEVPKIYV
jgi:zinc D-Ala-D-Ala carboxypeptidase